MTHDGHTAVIREDDLFLCSLCGSAEGATTSECPGIQMNEAQKDAVYIGTLDYRDKKWVTACSPHSPAAWRKQ